MTKKILQPQQESKHPATFEKDSHLAGPAGQNIGEKEALHSAADCKELTGRLDFTHEELAQVPLVQPGVRLQQGADYLDLNNFTAEPITASADMTATESNLYVAKANTPSEYWNRLVDGICGNKDKPAGDIPEETVDKTLADSFPTSDPPAWTTGREPVDPQAPQAPREKRADPDK